MKGHLALIIALATTLFAQESPKPPDAILTLYSPRLSTRRAISGGHSWASLLWIDHQRVTKIKLMPGHFLSLKLPNGAHAVTGWNFWGHESDAATAISLEPGKRTFVRLLADSHVVAGFGSTSYFGELITCEEAHKDGAALEPMKLKHVTEQFLDATVRESYFPECEIKR
jgi:hypothetical protein